MRRTLVVSAAANELRDRHYELDPVTGRYVRTVLLEPSATNLLLHSCDLSASQAVWGGASDFAISAATSIFAGQTAWRHTNLGTLASRSRSQVIGQFSGQAETLSAIVENVNAVTTSVLIFDVTAGASVCRCDLTWASGAVAIGTGTGTVRARRLANAGPNGGPVYRIIVTVTGTAGNQRRVHIYPSGVTQNTQVAIIHHVQHETGPVATSPIVTTTAAVTRAADVLTFPWGHSPGPYTIYLRFIEVGSTVPSGASRVLLQIGTAGSPTRLWIGQGSTGSVYLAALDGATGSASTALSTGPAIGDLVELLCRLYSDGSVQIEQSINGGAPTASARSSAVGLTAAWSNPVLSLSAQAGGGNPAPAAWLGWAIEVGSADATWDYMRAAVGW